MKKNNLLTLVKYAKETLTPEDVFGICKEKNKTHIIPRNVIEEYSHSEYVDDMMAVADFCDIDTLKYMLEKSFEESEDMDYARIALRAQIATNPNCDEEVFDILLKTHNSYVDFKIASNKYANSKVLSKICSRKRSIMAWKEATKNRNCSEAILRRLFKNTNSLDIIYEIAKSSYVPSDILQQMYDGRDTRIAYEAAKKLGCVDDFCERLLSSESDDDKILLAKITKSKEVLSELCKSENVKVICNAIKNNNCPMDEVVKFSNSDYESFRLFVAEKENVSISLLRKLSEDGSIRVREAVAKNCNTPIDILERLSYDAHQWVRAEVAKNPNTSDDTLYRMFVGDREVNVMYLAAKNIHTYWRFDFKSVFSKRCYYYQLYGYLENDSISSENLILTFLDKMYSEEIWRIIHTIASNINANDSIFDRIMEEMASQTYAKDTLFKAPAIRSIIESSNFNQLDEFVELYFS